MNAKWNRFSLIGVGNRRGFEAGSADVPLHTKSGNKNYKSRESARILLRGFVTL
ncbi:MAG: hypothetical protein [Olavius algarvensis Gamma 1 endosymbiont]|nr:MAG: hypothetical protein [Olavius algarvensis Gamma 1 endosymbiont]